MIAVRSIRVCMGAALLLVLAAAPAFARNDAYDDLAARMDQLAADRVLGSRAPAEMDRARASLAQLKEAGRGERDYLAYLTERRIEIARSAAQAEVFEGQLADLQRENDRLQLAAARRDAEQARAELERTRLQSQIRAEEAEREAQAARLANEQAAQDAESARAEADQAKRMAAAQAQASALARREAELTASMNGKSAKGAAKNSAKTGDGKASASRSMSLPDSVFQPGKATLAPGSVQQFVKAADFANRDPSSRVRVEVAAGGDAALAAQRGKALRDALSAAGIDAKRLTVVPLKANAKRITLTAVPR